MESPQAYEKVPIYRKSRDILRDSHKIKARMNKAFKHSLGARMVDNAMVLVEAVFNAYEERDDLEAKLRHILSIKKLNHRMLVLYRVANEVQMVTREDYGTQIKAIVHIIKQCSGWIKKTAQQVDAQGGDSQKIISDANRVVA